MICDAGAGVCAGMCPLTTLFSITLDPVWPGSPGEPGSPLIPWAAMLDPPFSPCHANKTKSYLHGIQFIININETTPGGKWNTVNHIL